MNRSRAIPRTVAGGRHASIALGGRVSVAELPEVVRPLPAHRPQLPTITMRLDARSERALRRVLGECVTKGSTERDAYR
jgi:hypothetical protein